MTSTTNSPYSGDPVDPDWQPHLEPEELPEAAIADIEKEPEPEPKPDLIELWKNITNG